MHPTLDFMLFNKLIESSNKIVSNDKVAFLPRKLNAVGKAFDMELPIWVNFTLLTYESIKGNHKFSHMKKLYRILSNY